MRRFRLNGWQRIGIVLSVLWVVVGGVWRFGDTLNTNHVWTIYEYCVEQPNADKAACKQEDQRLPAIVEDDA